MSQGHLTTDTRYFYGVFTDELVRINALGFSLIGMMRAAEDGGLEKVLDHNALYFNIEELAGLILEQGDKIRESLGVLQVVVRKGEIQIKDAVPEEIQ